MIGLKAKIVLLKIFKRKKTKFKIYFKKLFIKTFKINKINIFKKSKVNLIKKIILINKKDLLIET